MHGWGLGNIASLCKKAGAPTVYKYLRAEILLYTSMLYTYTYIRYRFTIVGALWCPYSICVSHIACGTEALEEMYIHMYSQRLPAARCSQIMWPLILAHSAFDYTKDTKPSPILQNQYRCIAKHRTFRATTAAYRIYATRALHILQPCFETDLQTCNNSSRKLLLRF